MPEFKTNWDKYKQFVDAKSLRIFLASMFLPDEAKWTIVPVGARRFTALVICDETDKKTIKKCKGHFMILSIGEYTGDAEDEPTG